VIYWGWGEEGIKSIYSKSKSHFAGITQEVLLKTSFVLHIKINSIHFKNLSPAYVGSKVKREKKSIYTCKDCIKSVIEQIVKGMNS